MRRRTLEIGTVAIALAICGGWMIGAPAEAGKKNLLFELVDERGDDYGDGSLLYPLRRKFERGDLDLLKLSAFAERGGTRFEATFARPIRVPANETIDDLGTQLDSIARYGFYTFNLDIYIDLDRDPESGAVGTMPGRQAVVRAEDAWDRAIILTPRPDAARAQLRRQIISRLSREMGDDPADVDSMSLRDIKQAVPAGLEERVFFPNRIRVLGNRVTFFVPESFLGGPAQGSWSYVVAVSGSDLIQSTDLSAQVGLADPSKDNLMILPVSPGTWENRFGGGREGQELQPPLVDIIVPAGMSQRSILADFDSRDQRPAELPGVVPLGERREVGP